MNCGRRARLWESTIGGEEDDHQPGARSVHTGSLPFLAERSRWACILRCPYGQLGAAGCGDTQEMSDRQSAQHANEAPTVQRTGGPQPARGGLLRLPASNQAVVALVGQATTPAADPQAVAEQYEGDALAYFEENMRAELMAAAGAEGIAIGRRASLAAGNAIRATCEPFEQDLELDTNILSTVFALSGGGASVTEGLSSGPKPNQPVATGAVNLSSRAVRAAQGLVQVWLPRLAGYRSVGTLKEAAIRESSEAANQAGEGGSSFFADYQNAVLDALSQEWSDEITATKTRIIRDQVPAGVVAMLRPLVAGRRTAYMDRLRVEYGAASSIGRSVEVQIVSSLQPQLTRLREHLDEAKTHRQRWQALGAITAGIAGGAAMGAGVGFFGGFGIGAAPGALVGGAVGLVGGLIGAATILWD